LSISKKANAVEFVPKEGRKDFWEIRIDGDEWRVVHRTIFGSKPRFPAVSDDSSVDDLFDQYEYERVKRYLLWRLSKQSCHSDQLAKQLRERLVQSHTIDQILEEFKRAGYLDDEAWLKAFMRGQQKTQGLPLILSKLGAKGLSPESLDGIAETYQDRDGELLAIRHLLTTRYRSKNLSDRNTRQKVIGSLLRRGFSYDQVRRALTYASEVDC
jgi:regulatory protein